jgi:YVTN family beta-propeller protein
MRIDGVFDREIHIRFKLAPFVTALLAVTLFFLLGQHSQKYRTFRVRAVQKDDPWRVYAPAILNGYTSYPSPSDGRASWSSPVAVDPSGQAIWVVNPDSGSVTRMETQSFATLEIPVGVQPWSLALSPDGRRVYVIDQATGELIELDGQSAQVKRRLAVGPEPAGIALTPSGQRAYISLMTAGQVVVVDLERLAVISKVDVKAWPFAIAVSDNGDSQDTDERVYITHLLSSPRPGSVEAADDSRQAFVSVLSAATNTLLAEIPLLPDAHGSPNLLRGISLSKDRAWVSVEKAAPALPNSLTTTVFASVAALDLAANREAPQNSLPLNDQDIFGSPVNNPMAAIPSMDGQTLYVVLGGSDLVEVVDISHPGQPRLVGFLPAGHNPRGLALSPDGHRAYVMNYLSRTLSILDLDSLLVVKEVRVTQEALSPEILAGKIYFNNASNPRLSQGSWISCASCHPDGASDGVTWMFPDGPRQTPPLWNAGETLPWHWSAALDEAQDVENTIQVIQHGLGLAPGVDPPLLGLPNSGRSEDLDDLAAFLIHGIRPLNLPGGGDVSQGGEIFQSAGCNACHGGPAWTLSTLPGPAGTLDPDGNGMVDGVLRQVGVHNPQDIRGETGFDPPSLLGVGLTAPYMHDGSLPDLETLLSSGHPDPLGQGNGLDEQQIVDLANFLSTIGPQTAPFPAP